MVTGILLEILIKGRVMGKTALEVLFPDPGRCWINAVIPARLFPEHQFMHS